METPPAKQNSYFSYFWLPYTANKSTILVLQPQQFECISTAEQHSHNLLDYWLRASYPSSRVIHCMVAAWRLARCFLYVVNNIPGYSFDSSGGAYGG